MPIDDSFVDSDGYAVAQTAGCTVLMICIVSLFVLHVHKSMEFLKSQVNTGKRGFRTTKESERMRKFSHIFTLSTLFAYALHAVFFTFDTYGFWAELSCDFSKQFSAFFYHMTKVCLYATLATRLMVGFLESSYARPIRITAYSVYIGSFLLGLVALYFDVANPVIYGRIVISQPDLHMHWCVLSEIPLWGILLTLSFDLILSLTCLIAFFYPLKRLVQQTNRIEDYILLLLQRYTLLTFVALFSSVVTLMFINYLHLSWFLLFDNLLNGLCIVMMSSFYNKWYNYLCFCKEWKCCMCGIKITRKITLANLHLPNLPKQKSRSKTGTGDSRENTQTETTSGGSGGGNNNGTVTSTASGDLDKELEIGTKSSNKKKSKNKDKNNKGTKNTNALIRYHQTIDMTAPPTIENDNNNNNNNNYSEEIPDASPGVRPAMNGHDASNSVNLDDVNDEIPQMEMAVTSDDIDDESNNNYNNNINNNNNNNDVLGTPVSPASIDSNKPLNG